MKSSEALQRVRRFPQAGGASALRFAERARAARGRVPETSTGEPAQTRAEAKGQAFRSHRLCRWELNHPLSKFPRQLIVIKDQRKGAGWALLGVGVLTTIPLVRAVLGKPERSAGS